MSYVGVHIGHNATVAVVRDGKLIFCESEERTSRKKNHTGFPSRVLEFVYQNVASRSEIARIGFCGLSNFAFRFLRTQEAQGQSYGHTLTPLNVAEDMDWVVHSGRELSAIRALEQDQDYRLDSLEYLAKLAGVSSAKVTLIDHHMCHGISTLPNARRWPASLIFTLDNEGDQVCATVGVYDGKSYRVLSRTFKAYSLGAIYSLATGVLGMKMDEHEYKLMGLAPYANPEHWMPIYEALKDLIFIDRDGQWRGPYASRQELRFKLEKIFAYKRFDNISAAVQHLSERCIVDWMRYWIRKTGISTVTASGGVFMNVKANQIWQALDEVSDAFVMPSAGDESTAIGCAFALSMRERPEQELEPIEHVYLGREFSDADVHDAIEKTGAGQRYTVHRHSPDSAAEAIASLLAEGEVVARCAGPMEFGARALGNRSILANPAARDVKVFINSAIKSRDFWMPFAPSILEEDLETYAAAEKIKSSPFMMRTYNCRPEWQQRLHAALHPSDMTLRPQTVSAKTNAAYHGIISRFKERSGFGAVLNTSFNIHGEPIVCSPEDAISTMDRSGLRHLCMNSTLISKH